MDEQRNHLIEGLTKVMFEEYGDKTKLTVETSVVGVAPQAAQMIQGMEAGWTQSLVCLEEFIDRKADPLIIERIFNAPVDLVWRSLTVTEEIRQWSFSDTDFEPVVGFEFHFTAKNEGIEYHHSCVVTDVIPLKRLTYSWRYDGYEGDSVVDFELYAEGNTTKLKLTHRGLQTFPSLPAFAKANFAEGWTSLTGFLKDHVEKQAVQ